MDLLQEETLKFWERLMVGAKVTIDGIEEEYPIHPSSYTEGNVLKKFVYLEDESGHVTHTYIHDQHGRPIREKTMNIRKGENGLIVTFFFQLDIKEGVSVG